MVSLWYHRGDLIRPGRSAPRSSHKPACRRGSPVSALRWRCRSFDGRGLAPGDQGREPAVLPSRWPQPPDVGIWRRGSGSDRADGINRASSRTSSFETRSPNRHGRVPAAGGGKTTPRDTSIAALACRQHHAVKGRPAYDAVLKMLSGERER